jgi:hypothetical protein
MGVAIYKCLGTDLMAFFIRIIESLPPEIRPARCRTKHDKPASPVVTHAEKCIVSAPLCLEMSGCIALVRCETLESRVF